MTCTIDHYMIDHLEGDNVVFANDTPIQSLPKAKALARKVSKKCDTGAYVVAFVAKDGGTFQSVGHVSFFNGYQTGIDGCVA